MDKHCENPPRRRLSFLKSARDEVKSGLKFQDWRSQRFSLFGSLIETLKMKLDKEKAKVSQLMTENGGFQLVRERSTGDNIFDAKRKVFSKNADGTIKKSVITARVTLRQMTAKKKIC